MRQRDFNRWVKNIASTLPEDFYYSYQKENKTVSLKRNDSGEEEVVPKDTDGSYIANRTFTTMIPNPVNHARRLKEIWKSRKNWADINNYLSKYNMELKYDNETQS